MRKVSLLAVPRRLVRRLALLTLATGPLVAAASRPPPSGLVEPTSRAAFRQPWTAVEIQAFLPVRGPFTFPAPYATEAIRLTNADDCGGADCVQSAAVNAHAGSDQMLAAVGLRGVGPTLFSYDKVAGRVLRLGPLFPPSSPYGSASAQGWYWSARRPTTLYLSGSSGPRLERYDVGTRALETVFDTTSQFGPGLVVLDTHSSADDGVHSAILADAASGTRLGCLTYREDTREFGYFPALGTLHQCRIDRGGRSLFVRDADASGSEAGRVIDLVTGVETALADGVDGPGAFRIWALDGASPAPTFVYRDELFGTIDVRQAPSVSSVPGGEDVCGGGSRTSSPGRADEIVCFRLDDPGHVRVLAQVMDAPGRGTDRRAPRSGSLDPSAGYFVWTSRLGGNRSDVVLVRASSASLARTASAASAASGSGSEDVVVSEAAPLPAPAASTPDPTRLPVATTAQVPLTTAYDALQVPAKSAGAYYLDPRTGVKVWKLTSAIFPAASPRWGHDYSEGGDEVSLPYNGTTRAVLVRQNGGSWWLVDFKPGVGVGIARPLTGNLAPLMDLAFTFSNNPATPYYAYVSSGTVIRRFDIRTMAEAPGNGWPVTGETSAMWLHQSENDGLFVWMRGANGSTVVGYQPSTGTRKTYTNPNLNEPRIDRAGRYVGLSMNTPLNGLVVWDWQTNTVPWTSPGDPGIPFAHNASLRRRWMSVDWNMGYPPDFAMFSPDLPGSAVHVGGPANGTTVHGNGSWIQHPANLNDQWALFCHYGSLRPPESYWLAPGGMVLVTPNGQRRLLGHPYNTTNNYGFFSFAKFSSDGGYVLFTSDMNGSGRSDVFLAEMPSGSLDTTPPTVSVSAPGAGAIVAGNAVAVSAVATDDVGVVGVQLRLDGAPLGAEDTSAPYGTTWNTTGAANGRHALTAVARDAAGHQTVSAPTMVAVDNTGGGPGPIVHLKLDEGTGTVASDSSGMGHPGSLVNGASWTQGHRGGAAALDGLNDLVRVPHAASLDAFPLTVAVWFKTTATTGVRGLLNKYVGGSYNGYQIFLNDGRLCAWYLRDTSNFVYDGGGCTLSTAGYNNGAWHQVVFVVDAAGGRLYVDGVQKAARGWTGAAGRVTTTQDLSLGYYPGGFGGVGFLPAVVDDVRVYDRALSPAEVVQLFGSS
jgi:hypothetical protein